MGVFPLWLWKAFLVKKDKYPPCSSWALGVPYSGKGFKAVCQTRGLLQQDSATMLSSGLRIPLLSLLLLLLLAAMELSWSFTDEEKKQIVDQHNRYRSMVSPSAANMRKMVSLWWRALVELGNSEISISYHMNIWQLFLSVIKMNFKKKLFGVPVFSWRKERWGIWIQSPVKWPFWTCLVSPGVFYKLTTF